MVKISIKNTKRHKISPYLFMQFAEPLGCADSSIDAAWDWLNERWQPGAVDMIKQLAPPMIRWGGCFSSYYHWYEAIGPQSERVPMLNLCWDGFYRNMVGTCELAELAKEVKSELLFCVNFESDGRKRWAEPKPGMNRSGDASEAADWVRYCNDPDHPLRKNTVIKNHLISNIGRLAMKPVMIQQDFPLMKMPPLHLILLKRCGKQTPL